VVFAHTGSARSSVGGVRRSSPTARGPLPELGRRGGGWVAAQAALIVLIALSALVGLGWRGGLAPAAYAVAAVLGLLGVALLVAGGATLGSALTPFPAPREGAGLRQAGVYGFVRHPMYGGGILVALGWSVAFATPAGLALSVALALFFELKSRREELWLERSIPSYREYRQHVRRRFLPFLW